MQPEQKILVADIGNSRLKLLAAGKDFSFSGQDYTALDFDENIKENLSGFLKKHPVGKVYYSSVNRENISKIKSILNNIGSYELINIEDALENQQLIDFSGIEGMGNDRKLGLIGALKHSMPPFITVDCGTAVTVNACDEEAKCLGGVIFAGIRTQLKALTQHTDALKNINPEYKGTSLGKNTESAMGAGIILSVAEGIQGIIKSIQSEAFDYIQVPVYLTGGGAVQINDALRASEYNFIACPYLVLEGILELISYNQ